MKKIMKKRVKRFESGGPAEDEFGPTGNNSPDVDQTDEAATTARINSMADRVAKGLAAKQEAGTERGMSPDFKRPEFVEGRDYTVAPSPVKAAPKKVAASKAKSMGGGRGSYAGYDKSQEVASNARREFAQNTKNQALEEVHPELMLNPGRIGTKAIMEAAQTLARGKGAAKAAAERIEPYMEKAAPYLKELPGRAKQLLLGEKPNFIMMKKGGAVKKMSFGGSTSKSSASSRGDGIASKGKTRGRIC
jgi:hypothetical protein